MVVTQSSSLVFLLLMGFAPVLWLSAIGYLMRTALMNMASPLYTAFCMEHTPEHQQGFVNSVLNLSWNIGWAVGPFVSGVVQQNYGFAPLFVATAVLYFFAIVLQWKFFDTSGSHGAGTCVNKRYYLFDKSFCQIFFSFFRARMAIGARR